MTGETKTCSMCGKSFYVPRCRINTAKYCSRKCKDAASVHTFTKPCEVCGELFSYIAIREGKAKYCSRKCYGKAMSKKGSITRQCKQCGKDFNVSPSEKRKFCSTECSLEYKRTIWNSSYTSVRKAMFVRGKITKCEICGYCEHPEILGVHHKDKNRKNNDLSNLIVVCPNCHSLLHRHHTPHQMF